MDQQQTIKAWANYVIERWQLEIIRLGINNTGQLLRSFTEFVSVQANGNVDKITFTYEYYGKFVDMGVGKGYKHGNGGDLGFTPLRKPRPWYNKVFFGQVKKLAELMKEKYEKEAVVQIVTNIETYDTNSTHASSNPSRKRSGNKVNAVNFIDNQGNTRVWTPRND